MATTDVALKDRLAAKAESHTGGQKTVLDLVREMGPQFARALPAHMSSERFLRIALTEVRRNPDLLDCSPHSLLGALMLSAQLGLEPGPLGHVYYVPFRNRKTGTREVTFIPGYRGLIDLARRSGGVSSIVAREVYEGDHFEFEYGLDDRLVHRPTIHAEKRGEVVAAYAICRYKDDTPRRWGGRSSPRRASSAPSSPEARPTPLSA